MKTVLSTKILSPSQKELFLNSGLGLVEYNALSIEFLEDKIPLEHKNYVFTSQNTVKVFIKQTEGLDRSGFRAFCVGDKTRSLLEDNGVLVVESTQYASELGKVIAQNYNYYSILAVKKFLLCRHSYVYSYLHTLTWQMLQGHQKMSPAVEGPI